MARYVYTGKKKDFKLANGYEYQEVIVPGVPFELKGKDLIMLKRCLDNAKEQGEVVMPFVLAEQYELQEEIKKEEEKAELEKVVEPKKRGRKIVKENDNA